MTWVLAVSVAACGATWSAAFAGVCTLPATSWPPVTRTSIFGNVALKSKTLNFPAKVVALVQEPEAKAIDGNGFSTGKLKAGAMEVFIGSLKVAVSVNTL